MLPHLQTPSALPVRQLMAMDAREMIRFPLIGVSMLTMMLILLIIHSGLWYAFTMTGAAPRVAVIEPRSVHVVTALAEHGLSTSPADGSANVRIATTQDRVNIVIDDPPVAWDSVWQALRSAPIPASHITVLDARGDVVPDFLRLNLGTTLVAGIASIALLGTAVPIVAMRERGTLRLIGTTPTPRAMYLLSLFPLRLALVMIITAAIATISIVRRYGELDGLPHLLVTVVCGSVMLFGASALVASRARSTEAVQQAMVTITLLMVFSAGGAVPLALLPPVVQTLSAALPGSWLASSAGEALSGIPTTIPSPICWALMVVTGVACFFFAARRFRWDDREDSPVPVRTSPSSRPSENGADHG